MGTRRLPVVFCLLVDFPENKESCWQEGSRLGFGLPPEPKVCFKCPMAGKFLTGDTLEDHGSAGHVICVILWILTIIIGTLGTAANVLIISITKKHGNKRSFDFLLEILATFDFLSSVTSVISSTAIIVYFENLSRGPVTLFMYYMPFLLCLLGRSGSSYMTVLITLERYLIIKFPNSRVWFTPTNTKILTGVVIVLAVLINIPRLSSLVVDYNDIGQNVPSLYGLQYIIRSTSWEEFWYETLGSIHYQIDIWGPFPLLLIFNILLFIEVKKFAKRRTELNRKDQREVRASRMFIPVVFVLFICNIEPITHYIVLKATKNYYRELVMGLLLSIAINSAANLPIYYARGPSFRKEIRTALPSWCECLKPKDEPPTSEFITGKNTPAPASVSNSSL